MWVPESARAVADAVASGSLEETASFDAKAALPGSGRSKDLAADVAAMANDGGVLLYGVGEDEHGRPAVLTPIPLAGAAERVDQIVRTCVSEPPEVRILTLPDEEDPATGYLVVSVPPSPRAPHMVTVGGDHRYYGRSAVGNARLTEGEVARLYERRARWDVNREALLDEEVASSPLEPHEDFAYLYLVVKPVVPDENLLDRAAGEDDVPWSLNRLFSTAMRAHAFPWRYSPDFPENNSFERRADGWATYQGFDEDGSMYGDQSTVLTFQVDLDGGGHLFCARAAERYDGRLLIFEDIAAGLTAKALAVLGALYDAASYLGPVDAGLAVTGLAGGVSSHLNSRGVLGISARPYDRDEYRRTGRFSASTLVDEPRSAARALVLPLARATTRESYDPFARM